MRDRHRVFLMHGDQHGRVPVAQIIDQTVVETAIAGARVEGDMLDAEFPQHVGDDVAAPPHLELARIDRPFHRPGFVIHIDFPRFTAASLA